MNAATAAIQIGADTLRNTDICDHALEVLASAGARVRRVVVLGRRGHVQASFTIKAGFRARRLYFPGSAPFIVSFAT